VRVRRRDAGLSAGNREQRDVADDRDDHDRYRTGSGYGDGRGGAALTEAVALLDGLVGLG
jgi:hypothetical protein